MTFEKFINVFILKFTRTCAHTHTRARIYTHKSVHTLFKRAFELKSDAYFMRVRISMLPVECVCVWVCVRPHKNTTAQKRCARDRVKYFLMKITMSIYFMPPKKKYEKKTIPTATTAEKHLIIFLFLYVKHVFVIVIDRKLAQSKPSQFISFSCIIIDKYLVILFELILIRIHSGGLTGQMDCT